MTSSLHDITSYLPLHTLNVPSSPHEAKSSSNPLINGLTLYNNNNNNTLNKPTQILTYIQKPHVHYTLLNIALCVYSIYE